MSLTLLGVVVGLVFGMGLSLVVAASLPVRPTLATHVLPYVPEIAARLGAPVANLPSWRPPVAGSLTGRLARAGLGITAARHRVERLRWGASALAVAAVGWLIAGADPARQGLLLVLVVTGAAGVGVGACELRLVLSARIRQRRMAEELPAVAEQIAAAVWSGLPLDRALSRVQERGRGVLVGELARLQRSRDDGLRLSAALRVTGEGAVPPPVERYLVSLGVALERGSPMPEVAAAQASAVLEGARRSSRPGWVLAVVLLVVSGWSSLVALLTTGVLG